MFFNAKPSSARALILLFFSLSWLITLLSIIFVNINYVWISILAFALLVLAIDNSLQRKHTILRNHPVVGYIRYLLEGFRPELRQYLWESDLHGRLFSRRQRSIVNQRAKGARENVAFGTLYGLNAPAKIRFGHLDLMFQITVLEWQAIIKKLLQL